MTSTGRLKVHCFLEDTYIPLVDVKVEVFECDKDFNNIKIVKTAYTNESGCVDNIILLLEGLEENEIGAPPYGTFNIFISKDGYKGCNIKGVQVFPGRKAIQRCRLEKGCDGKCAIKTIVIPEHKHVKQGCSKAQESCNGTQTLKFEKEKEKCKKKCKKHKQTKFENSLRVLDNVQVPEYITVHTGAPSNSYAPNCTLGFVDYIKNVASSELYATWTSDALRANIYCIISFVLNRVYTEWYPSRGYNFDITNDTAYDQAFVVGRTTYNSINIIVDQIFTTYIQRQGTEQPLLAEFCNGTTSVCPDWLSQWGSQSLGKNGYTPYEILTYYYGSNINLVQAQEVKGYPHSYPDYPLDLWTSGANVEIIQKQLNRISVNYPAIEKLSTDGIFGPKTEASVKEFQQIFDLPMTGIVNRATWYAISRVFVGVTKEAELN